ncbi:PqqD family protein [Patescibacteria group bacterium]
MGDKQTYKTNDAKVISEVLDGETILINLETGNYYSMNDTGSTVWKLLQVGSGVDGMKAALVAGYEVDDSAAAKDLQAFLDTLQADELIVAQAADAAHQAPPAAPPTTRRPFEAPAMTKYEDMQQMLLADPIHDVDEQGWPVLIKS